MILAEKIALLRRQNGWSQEELADQLNVSRQAVSKWEKGSYPDCELLPKLSQIMDVSLDVLFGLKDEDGKISLNTSVIEEVGKLDEAEKGKRAMELIYTLLCAFRTGPSMTAGTAKTKLFCITGKKKVRRNYGI